MSELEGQHILVTGANRGIGLALTNHLNRAGAHVIGTVREDFNGMGEMRERGIDYVYLDLANHGSVGDAVEDLGAILKEATLNGAIFNAAYIPREKMGADTGTEDQQIRHAFETNYMGNRILLTDILAQPNQLSTGFRGIHISSVAANSQDGDVGSPHQAAYGSSKAAFDFHMRQMNGRAAAIKIMRDAYGGEVPDELNEWAHMADTSFANIHFGMVDSKSPSVGLIPKILDRAGHGDLVTSVDDAARQTIDVYQKPEMIGDIYLEEGTQSARQLFEAMPPRYAGMAMLDTRKFSAPPQE